MLSYVARQSGHPRKLDVEGLTAAVISQHGIGGAEAGYPTQLVFERGTVALDPKWDDVLGKLWPGRLKISRSLSDDVISRKCIFLF